MFHWAQAGGRRTGGGRAAGRRRTGGRWSGGGLAAGGQHSFAHDGPGLWALLELGRAPIKLSGALRLSGAPLKLKQIPQNLPMGCQSKLNVSTAVLCHE